MTADSDASNTNCPSSFPVAAPIVILPACVASPIRYEHSPAVPPAVLAPSLVVAHKVPASIRRAPLLIGVLALSLSNVASAQGRANRIRSFDAVLTVHADGSIDVVEELTVRLADKSHEFVRDLSLRDDGAPDGKKKLDLKVLAITDEDGQPLRAEETVNDNGWTRRLRIWTPSSVDADGHIAIRYQVVNAIHSFNAGKRLGALDEAHWNVIGTGDMPIDSVHARVVLPAGARATRTAVYAVPNQSAVTDVTRRSNGNQVSFALPRGLSPHQAMTISVGWPYGYLQSKPTRSLWNRLAPVLTWWPLLIPLIVLVFAFRAWDKIGRDPKEKSQVVCYEPVDGVSPAGLEKLVSGERESQMRLITATLIDLAVRGFLRIEETTPNILLTLTKDVREIAQSMLHGASGRIDYIIHFVRPRSEWKGLKWHEERLLDGLVNAGPTDGITTPDSVRVSMLSNKFYVSVPEIMEAIEFELVSKGYYRTRPGRVNLKWFMYATIPLFVGGLAGKLVGALLDLAWMQIFDEAPVNASMIFSDNKFLLGMLLSTLILIGFAAIMPSRTVVGARAREAALGFKEFLGRVGTMPSVELLERYLPYAIAFGVENKWAHAFEGIYVKAPAWYTGPMGDFSASSFGNRITDLTISAASSMSSSPSQTLRG
jgi:hypothetical protein